jgi:hypothetical protein
MDAIAQSVLKQYDRAWRMLEFAIVGCPDEAWTAGEAPMEPARVAFHACGAADYLGRLADEPLMPSHCGLNPGKWLDVPQDDLPSKEQIREFFEHVKAKWRAFLETKPDSWFGEKNPGFEWTGDTRLEQCLYNLRHVMLHVGHMDLAVRQANAEPVDWR